MRRIELYPEVAEQVAQVPDSDISGCLHALTLTSINVVGYHAPELDDALAQLRDRGTVGQQHRLSVGVLLAQRDQAAFAAARRGDETARETAFFQARAINCAAYAIGGIDGPPRQRLEEAAYEAVTACRDPRNVISVLAGYSA